MSPILKLRGLSKSFGAVVVADELSYEMQSGEALGIIGPNGAGKTTMFNLIIRGRITKEDMDIIRKCRGIALDKGNYENDDSNWRPICIREAR